MDSSEPGQTLDALPAGCLFPDWIARRGISKSTAYQWRNDLKIEPERRRVGTRVEVWLSSEQEQLLNSYGDALGRGLSVPDALAAVGRPAPVESDGPGTMVPLEFVGMVPAASDSSGAESAAPVESDGEQRIAALRQRLAALRDAVELGAPLSTQDVALLLGARPGGSVVVRGRLRAVREARNLWTIEPD